MKWTRPIAALNCLLLATAAFLYVITSMDPTLIGEVFWPWAYFLMVTLFVLWIGTLIELSRSERPDPRAFARKYGAGIGICFVITGSVFLTVRPAYRVVRDDVDLLSIARTMTYEQRADDVTEGKWINDVFRPVARRVPKRPLVFPFFMHILNVALGYRASNVFILNFLILFAFLSTIYILLKGIWGGLPAIVGVILVVSQPVVTEGATSGGYELCSALFFLISMLCLYRFLRGPSALNFHFLWVHLLMYSNIRYEGVLTFGIVISSLCFLRYLRGSFFSGWRSFTYAMTPMILLLIYWPRLVVENEFTMGMPFSLGGLPFHPGYIPANLGSFFRVFFDGTFFYPYAPLVNVLGVAGLLYGVGRRCLRRKEMTKPVKHLAILAGSCLAVNLLLRLSFHAADARQPAMSRYYLVYAVLASLAALFFLRGRSFVRREPRYLAVIAAVLFMMYHPVAMTGRYIRGINLFREYVSVLGFFRREKAAERDFLIVSKNPEMYVVQGMGAVSFDYANQFHNIGKDVSEMFYRDVYVIQDLDLKAGIPVPETRLSDRYGLKTMLESRTGKDRFTRVSKVTSIRR